MSTLNIIFIVLAIVAVAVAAWALVQKEKTRKLKNKFVQEYDRVIEQEKNAYRGEALLDERQKRVARLNIRALTREECDTYSARWRTVQEHFVDDPGDAVAQADSLVTDAMRLRGYPMSDFEQRAADLSVDHPTAVEDYRVAHSIAVRDAEGSASTEDLRKAMQHYRSLFEHVLDTHVLQHH